MIYGQLRQMRLFPERKPRPERWHRRGSHMPSSPTVRGKERIGCQKLASDLHTHALAHIQTRTKHIKHHFKKKQKAAPSEASCSGEALVKMFPSFFLAIGLTMRIQETKDFSSKEIVLENVRATSLRFQLDAQCWQENPLPMLWWWGGQGPPLHRGECGGDTTNHSGFSNSEVVILGVIQ